MGYLASCESTLSDTLKEVEMDMPGDTNEKEPDLPDEEVEEVDLGDVVINVGGIPTVFHVTQLTILFPPNTCPWCEQEVGDGLESCPHCGKDLDVLDIPTPFEVEEVGVEDDEE